MKRGRIWDIPGTVLGRSCLMWLAPAPHHFNPNSFPALKVVSQARPDHDKHLVHVTLDIKRDTLPPPAGP